MIPTRRWAWRIMALLRCAFGRGMCPEAAVFIQREVEDLKMKVHVPPQLLMKIWKGLDSRNMFFVIF